MSVDLFCYSSDPAEEVNKVLDSVKKQHPEIFNSDFLIFNAKASSAIHKEIALEHQFDANSIFIVSLNNKSASTLVIEVADKLRVAFGKDELLVLHNNEVAI
jgi:hypothetical protein